MHQMNIHTEYQTDIDRIVEIKLNCLPLIRSVHVLAVIIKLKSHTFVHRSTVIDSQ